MGKISKPITLQVIADHAGVTRALVSMALRNSPKVAANTKKRIQQIAHELGYQMNPMLRALMTSVRNRRVAHYHATLAFVTNFPSAMHWQKLFIYPEYFSGAKERAEELGYRLEHFWLGEYKGEPARLADVLEARGIPGILLPPLPQNNRSFNFDLGRFSAVTFGYSIPLPNLPRVCNHHLQTIIEAIERLQTLGYNRIGIALSEWDIVQVNHLWIAGLAVAQRKFPHLHFPVLSIKPNGGEAFKKWFKKERLEVVITAWRDVWEWMKQLGRNIPDEVGFFHLDCRKGEYYSGMYQNTFRLAQTAVEMLINRIESNVQYNQEEPRILMLNSSYNEGHTIRVSSSK